MQSGNPAASFTRNRGCLVVCIVGALSAAGGYAWLKRSSAAPHAESRLSIVAPGPASTESDLASGNYPRFFDNPDGSIATKMSAHSLEAGIRSVKRCWPRAKAFSCITVHGNEEGIEAFRTELAKRESDYKYPEFGYGCFIRTGRYPGYIETVQKRGPSGAIVAKVENFVQPDGSDVPWTRAEVEQISARLKIPSSMTYFRCGEIANFLYLNDALAVERGDINPAALFD